LPAKAFIKGKTYVILRPNRFALDSKILSMGVVNTTITGMILILVDSKILQIAVSTFFEKVKFAIFERNFNHIPSLQANVTHDVLLAQNSS